MRIRKVVNRAVTTHGKGLHVEAGVNAVVAANVGEKHATTAATGESPRPRGDGATQPR